MAAVPIPAGSIIVSVTTFIYGLSECEHKLYWRTKVGFADMIAFCVFVMNDVMVERLMTHMVAAVELRSVTCALVSAELFTSQTVFPANATYGALPELGVYPPIANVWQLRTNTAGRSGRGRIFTFGFPNAYVDNYHKLSDFAFARQRTLANQFEARYGADGDGAYAMMGVFSRKLYQQTGDESTSFFPLKLINIQSRLSTRSSRRN